MSVEKDISLEQNLSEENLSKTRKIIRLFPSEKLVLEGIIDCFAKNGKAPIGNLKKALLGYFEARREKFSGATIFQAVKGLEAVGLLIPVKLKRTEPGKEKILGYNLNQKLLKSAKIMVQDGLSRKTVSSGLR